MMNTEQLKQEIANLELALEELRADAERYRNLKNFLAERGGDVGICKTVWSKPDNTGYGEWLLINSANVDREVDAEIERHRRMLDKARSKT